jgi:hypothetical protein
MRSVLLHFWPSLSLSPLLQCPVHHLFGSEARAAVSQRPYLICSSPYF